MILITGGAGYIGSHVNKALSKKGVNTVIIDNLVTGHEEFVRWGELFYGDVGDISTLECIFKKFNIKAVLHFAAYAYVGESMKMPEKYYINNVSNTLSLLKVMRKYDCKKMIFIQLRHIRLSLKKSNN